MMKTIGSIPANLGRIIIALAFVVAALGPVKHAFGARAQRVQAAIWANNQLYDTVLTDTDFKSPPTQSTDIIFNFMNSGLSGQRSVAEAAPGDFDYNGGRWNVMAVTFTEAGLNVFDPDGDGVVNFELTNAEEVLDYADMGLLSIQETGTYFECPLLPRHGNQ